MVADENPHPAEKVLREFLDARTLDELERLLSDDIEVTDWMQPGVVLRGREEVIRVLFTPIALSFADEHFEVHQMIAAGDRVLVHGYFNATFSHDYFGIPAHGRRVRWTAHDIYQVKDGQICRMWWGNDTLTVARQLGAVPDDGKPW